MLDNGKVDFPQSTFIAALDMHTRSKKLASDQYSPQSFDPDVILQVLGASRDQR